MAAAIAHDAPHLLAFDIAIDPSHPRVDLGEQQTFAGLEHMVSPGNRALRGGLDTSQATLAREADQARHPISAVFDRPWEIAEPGMRPHHHQEIRKAIDQDAEKGLRPGATHEKPKVDRDAGFSSYECSSALRGAAVFKP